MGCMAAAKETELSPLNRKGGLVELVIQEKGGPVRALLVQEAAFFPSPLLLRGKGRNPCLACSEQRVQTHSRRGWNYLVADLLSTGRHRIFSRVF